ncbi:MAG: NADH-quinone oxidoreductase subunit J [Verrucomicrobia bacterium]|nr:NADH-quinone oxidoreductase subunit J [Verrucomicrobiota bacterium]
MPAAFFYIFSAITLLFGVMVVVCRNPVASALSLVVSFAGLAALFVSLDAYFIGTIQILVYAGAVMVLFLFIIMLLDIKAEEHRQPNALAIVGGIALAVIFVGQLGYIVSQHEFGNRTTADVPILFDKAAQVQKLETIKSDLRAGVLPDTKLVGQTLFQRYGFQIQLVGALLLAGTVGVVILSKREVK